VGTRAARVGLIAVAFCFVCQWLTVHENYGGNWTALFRIRPGMPVPDFLKSENLYIFQNSAGYDGQVYHLIAHDPWMRKGSFQAIGGAPFRYQRIFVPALAWALAFGHDAWIHTSYFTVMLGFVFLGVYWTSQFALQIGRSHLWGLGFLLAPATIVSLDRMTADIALAAFAAGFAFYAFDTEARPSWKLFAILTCAALTRETALPMIAAYAIYLATRKRLALAALTVATAIPALLWFLHLSHLGRSDAPDYISPIPLAGFFDQLAHPMQYALSPFKTVAATALDYAALLGIAIALALTIRLAIQRRWDPRACAIYALALAMVLVRSRSVWEDVYAYGRVFTPFLLLLALDELLENPWLAAIPILLADTRISLNLVTQASGILDGLLRPLLK
jgi:hypothetical protein